jgi:hypothetical protein
MKRPRELIWKQLNSTLEGAFWELDRALMRHEPPGPQSKEITVSRLKRTLVAVVRVHP